ncbi:hypothetical protein XF_0022 [Xylella fastidiosa 9a5c]|uniref:Uncharacterized protein n=1 Tax=Xylella fastidiosa (strain 9a5c) TaxID=160492 RepID=Q9PHC2_XYLFA|nr:hypothetical protein XF_0022 [Xylella fastidiosa 9a5c]
MCKTPFDLCAVECDMPRHFGLPLCSDGVCLCQACRRTMSGIEEGRWNGGVLQSDHSVVQVVLIATECSKRLGKLV